MNSGMCLKMLKRMKSGDQTWRELASESWKIADYYGQDPARVGLDHIGDGFRAVGWQGFLAILLLSLFRFTARSLAWITLMTRPGGTMVLRLRNEPSLIG